MTGNRVEQAERNISEQNGAFTAALKDSLSGFSVMKSFQAEKMIAALFSKHNADAEHAKCEKRKLVTVINGMAEALEEHVREEGIAVAQHLEKEIALKKVSFGYEADCEVLHDITYSFEAGKSYAVVGASGSGKSTLLNLLMAGNAEYAGEICYDGQELKEISSEALYDQVSFIQQSVFIFNASIWDNITMFHAFPKEDVELAIEQAGLKSLIAEQGKDYLCGENGSGLSGGEKQRIAIVRSLLKKSHILLVDEATSALDTALLKHYDAILALKNGRLEESGSFEELMQRNGYFYSLFTVS